MGHAQEGVLFPRTRPGGLYGDPGTVRDRAGRGTRLILPSTVRGEAWGSHKDSLDRRSRPLCTATHASQTGVDAQRQVSDERPAAGYGAAPCTTRSRVRPSSGRPCPRRVAKTLCFMPVASSASQRSGHPGEYLSHDGWDTGGTDRHLCTVVTARGHSLSHSKHGVPTCATGKRPQLLCTERVWCPRSWSRSDGPASPSRLMSPPPCASPLPSSGGNTGPAACQSASEGRRAASA